MAREIFPLKDVNYGSNDSGTVNTATDTYSLQAGSIGLYGIPKSGANANKVCLITDGASGAGLVDAAAFDGDTITVALGVAEGSDNSVAIDLANLKVDTKAYDAPVKQLIAVGYHPVDAIRQAQSLNLPSLSKNDEASILLKDMNDLEQQPQVGKPFSGYVSSDGEAAYGFLADMLARVNESDLAQMDIFANGTITELTSTIDPTFVQGSKVVSLSGAGDLQTVGTYWYARGAVYKIVDVADANSFTLDRPYLGASETIDTDATTDLAGTIASFTEWGFTLTDFAFGQATKLSLDGILADADKSVVTEAVLGSGAGAQVVQMETDAIAKFGVHDLRASYVPQKGIEALAASNYDLYTLKATNSRYTSDPHGAGKENVAFDLVIAADTTGDDTTGKNASDLEDILATLGVSLVSIVA